MEPHWICKQQIPGPGPVRPHRALSVKLNASLLCKASHCKEQLKNNNNNNNNDEKLKVNFESKWVFTEAQSDKSKRVLLKSMRQKNKNKIKSYRGNTFFCGFLGL